jgi:hypothetical protein
MSDLKLSTWIILLALFSAGIATTSAWVVGINDAYGVNASTDWSNSLDKMSDISNRTTSIREKMSSGEDNKVTAIGTAEVIWSGTVSSIMTGINSLGLIDDMIKDFQDQSGLDIPTWVLPLIVTIIVTSLLFGVASAWLKRGT